MAGKVDLYDSHYALTEAELYRQIRLETYGEDLGQTSWITAQEARKYLAWLEVGPNRAMLEVACGSGGVPVLAAREFGAAVTGIDIHDGAVRSAQERAVQEGVAGRVSFQVQDASQPLNFDESSFDAVFCNDSINHLPDRAAVLRGWHRLLKPAGKILYTDPIVMTGQLSNQEIAIRSSIGFFLFTPPDENERLIREAGFEILRVEDVTTSTVQVSHRWYQAREKSKQLILEVEGQERYEALQRFLETVHCLAAEQRLSRFAYLARKPV